MEDIFCSYTWIENGVTRHCRNAAKLRGGYCDQHKQTMPVYKKTKWDIASMQSRLKEWAKEASKNIDTGHIYTEEELKELFS